MLFAILINSLRYSAVFLPIGKHLSVTVLLTSLLTLIKQFLISTSSITNCTNSPTLIPVSRIRIITQKSLKPVYVVKSQVSNNLFISELAIGCTLSTGVFSSFIFKDKLLFIYFSLYNQFKYVFIVLNLIFTVKGL